jgi:hypothetical protein
LIFVKLALGRASNVGMATPSARSLTMKMVLLVCNSYFNDRVMKVLKESGIDYYTSWDKARGKGHGTEPHLGTGGFASTNSVTMIAFEEEAPLEALIRGIAVENETIKRPADRIRLFQMPLERIV